MVLRKGGSRTGDVYIKEVELKKIPVCTIGSCQYYKYTLKQDQKLTTNDPTFPFFSDHKPTVFLPFQYLESDTVSSKMKIATIISVDDHQVYHNGGFAIPSISDGQVEGHSDIDNVDDQLDENGMAVV
jgi:hypothetical protein